MDLTYGPVTSTVAVMTTSAQSSAIPVRLPFEERAAGFYRAVVRLDHAATEELDRAGIDARLRDLVRIRASQLNGCAYCIDMHTKDARAAGETEQRLYALPAFTESVTLLARDHVPEAAYEAVAAEFGGQEIAALLSLIVAINAWNALSVSTRAWAPG